MKCEKCGNEYPSYYYFAVETICKECFNKMSPEEQTSLIPNIYGGMVASEFDWRASFGIRLGAALLDYLFFIIILMIILFASGIMSDYMNVYKDLLNDRNLILQFTNAMIPYIFIVTFMYYSLEIILAATPGKAVLGLQIAAEDRHHAGYEKLVMRFFFKHLSSILSLAAFWGAFNFLDKVATFVSFLIFIGFFFVLAPKRQAFHDMLAKTAVFRRKDVING